jgi:hypothetical protein
MRLLDVLDYLAPLELTDMKQSEAVYIWTVDLGDGLLPAR